MNETFEYVWVRVGDEDGYHEFDTVEDAAQYLAMAGVRKIERGIRFGVTSDEYRGNNYISLYWGPVSADANRELTDEELAEVNESLDSCNDCGYFNQ